MYGCAVLLPGTQEELELDHLSGGLVQGSSEHLQNPRLRSGLALCHHQQKTSSHDTKWERTGDVFVRDGRPT